MKKTLLSFLVTLSLAGCMSAPPPEAITFPQENKREVAPATEPEPTNEVLAPVDQWKRALEKILPAGWALEDPSDQNEAPFGWERIQGGRGIELGLVNQKSALPDGGGSRHPRFVAALFPVGWEGRAQTAGLAFSGDHLLHVKPPKKGPFPTDTECLKSARFFGKSGDWLMFFNATGHEGWERPEEDVARALGISRS